MMRAWQVECLKLRRKHTLLIALVMLLVELFWLSFALFWNGDTFATQGFQTMFYQLPLLNSLFFPVMIGVMVSRICDIEHKGSHFKSLFTMQKKTALLSAKGALCVLFSALLVAVQIGFVVLLGQLAAFEDALLWTDMLSFFLSQTATGSLLVVLFLVLALSFKNQFIPFIVGIVVGFLGFLSAFFPPVIMRLIPSAYFMYLSTVGMDWQVDTRVVTYYVEPFKWGSFGGICAVTALLFALSLLFFNRKEV